MKFKMTNRQSLSAAVILFYLLPLLFFAFYSIGLMSPAKSWGVLSFGLLLVSLGSLSLILLLYYWEQSIGETVPAPALSVSDSISVESAKAIKVTLLEQNPIFEPSLPAEDRAIETNSLLEENSKEFTLLHSALKESRELQERLKQDLEMKTQELLESEKEKEELQSSLLQLTEDFSDYKLFSEEQVKQKQIQLNNLQNITEDQRAEMDRRQEQIHQLDTKIRDLSYEIKTLLYLHEEENTPSKNSLSPPVASEEKKSVKSDLFAGKNEKKRELDQKGPLITEIFSDEVQIKNSFDASRLLKKCIQTAVKLTGANHQGNESSRYREFSSTYYAIDQRRLFDSLRNETGALIVVCAPKEQKLLFAGQYSKNLLGWSPEKLIVDFTSIMQEGLGEWNKAISQLTADSETQIRLLAKTKQGNESLLNCRLGSVPSGLFRRYTIGILYPN